MKEYLQTSLDYEAPKGMYEGDDHGFDPNREFSLGETVLVSYNLNHWTPAIFCRQDGPHKYQVYVNEHLTRQWYFCKPFVPKPTEL